ncbi:MAG: alpha-L-fucosidase [Kiritimatiellaeota bacterium]|nr:alpha-L-fucosidase [Kiritimatiellota bacterium]
MAKKRGDIYAFTKTAARVDEQPAWLVKRQEWFRDQKFGFFMHWGPYSQWGCLESWPLVGETDAPWARSDQLKPWLECGKNLEEFRRRYRALNRTFNPVQFNPEPWADLAWRAGMRYVCFTTKHHDGFCMFDTRATDYRITHADCPFHSHPRANVAKEIFNTFRRRGFAASCYFSKSDWHHPDYWIPERPAPDRNPNYDTHAEPERWERFVQFVHRQFRELLTDYGKIDILWLDGGQVRPPHQDIRMHEIAAFARLLQPELLIADRTVGGPFENIVTPEQEIPDKPLGVTWESCLTMGDQWAYKPDDRYKPTRKLIHILIDIAAKDGNLLLNVGPTPEGTLPSEAVMRLKELGDWMAVNGEAIHGTRAMPPYAEGNLRFTQKGKTVYAFVLPTEGEANPAVSLKLANPLPPAGGEIRLLGRAQPLVWRIRNGLAEIDLPTDRLPCQHAWALTWRT